MLYPVIFMLLGAAANVAVITVQSRSRIPGTVLARVQVPTTHADAAPEPAHATHGSSGR